METRKVARIGMLMALAMILSYVESLFPAFTSIPGVRIGLANLAVVFALYTLGFREAFAISLLRVVLSSLLFGTVLSMAYSASGAVLSLAVMAVLKRTGLFGVPAVSVCGAVSHNLGQIGVACLILNAKGLIYYVPVLIIAGVASGLVIGLTASVLVSRIGSVSKESEDGKQRREN